MSVGIDGVVVKIGIGKVRTGRGAPKLWAKDDARRGSVPSRDHGDEISGKTSGLCGGRHIAGEMGTDIQRAR
jgi:hypothetical protein